MLSDFYKSKEWEHFRPIVINERLVDGTTICEYCGQPIVKPYDLILHHCNTYLTEENYKDVRVSLNPDNIQLVHHRCHNKIHNKLGYARREVYIVYGSPLSGKSTYVDNAMTEGDLLIDIDRIWKAISGCELYVKPKALNSVVFGVRDKLLETVKYRQGNWNNCYVIGGYPYKAERERLVSSLGAREIYIESTKEECLARLYKDTQRNKEEWTKYIDNWFNIFQGNY